jgi:hypothetical protein
MTKYQTADSYPVEPVELTPTRRALAELLDARTAKSADLATLIARQTKLARASAEIAPLQDELNALTAAETAAMQKWSEADTDTPPPVSDVKRRARIESSIAAARAARTAADGATAGLSPQITRVSNDIRALTSRIEQAVASIVVSEAELLFPSLKAGIAALEALKARVDGARRFMLTATEPLSGQVVGAVKLDFDRFDRELEHACARPTRPMVPDMGEWQSFAAALKDSASATMEFAL